MVNALYSKKVAREILEESGALGRCVVVKKKGVFPAVARDKLMPEESKLLRWRPARVMTRPKGSPSVNDTPMLPPEFSGRELAAFMLAGAGAMVAVFFGNWEDGPDHASLERLDEDSGARQAVVDAFDAYREAVGKVGKRELELDRRARESCTAYSNARSEALLQHRVSEAPQPQPGDSDTRRRELDAEYQRRLALVEGDVSALEAEMNRLQAEDKAAEQKWLHAMVAELLKPDTGPAEHGAELAPQVGPVVQPEATTRRPKSKRRTWWDVSSLYIVGLMRAGQYGTGKELYRALEAKAGPESPFDKGQGTNRGCLFVREIAQSLSMKTVQNKFGELRELAQKVTP